jgi:hypothetical protein
MNLFSAMRTSGRAIRPTIIPGYVRLAPGIIWAAPAVMALADACHERLSAARSYVLLPHDRQIHAVANPQRARAGRWTCSIKSMSGFYRDGCGRYALGSHP